MNENNQESTTPTEIKLEWRGNYAECYIGPLEIGVFAETGRTYQWFKAQIRITKTNSAFHNYEAFVSWHGTTPEEAVESALKLLPGELEAQLKELDLQPVSEYARALTSASIRHVDMYKPDVFATEAQQQAPVDVEPA